MYLFYRFLFFMYFFKCFLKCLYFRIFFCYQFFRWFVYFFIESFVFIKGWRERSLGWGGVVYGVQVLLWEEKKYKNILRLKIEVQRIKLEIIGGCFCLERFFYIYWGFQYCVRFKDVIFMCNDSWFGFVLKEFLI